MHWGWIASATGNVTTYIWASRFRLAITTPDDAEPARDVQGETLLEQPERIEQPQAEPVDQPSDDDLPITDGGEISLEVCVDEER